jgi:hypothetical protein
MDSISRGAGAPPLEQGSGPDGLVRRRARAGAVLPPAGTGRYGRAGRPRLQGSVTVAFLLGLAVDALLRQRR